jgi:membrane fusion protein, multidrug efflux system
MKLRHVLFFFVIAAVVQFGCGSKGSSSTPADKAAGQDSTNSQQSDTNATGSPQMSQSNDPGIPIEVTPVTRGEISSYLLYNSTLETEQMADVFARIQGIAEKIYVEEGDRVSRNQALLQIEEEEYALAEQKARLEYDTKLSEFKRFEALKDKNLISEEEFDNARLAVRQAELAWKQAKLNLDYTIVRSPIDGVIGERMAKIGDRIQTSTRLFVVTNPNEKVVKVYVPQDELPKCSINQQAIIQSDVMPEKVFQGWVKRISPIVDPTSGTFKATAGVRDPQNLLRPGMFVSVRLIVDVRPNTMLIPKTALIYENERTYFFVVGSDTVQKLELKKGFEDAEKVEVLNSIPDTAKIVVVGQGGLKEGSSIKILKEKYYHWQVLPGKEESGKVS